MFSFMKKDKADKREKKERKETKKPPTKDAAAASLFHQQSSSGSGSGGVVYGASAAAGSSSANVDKLTADELLRLDEVRRSLKIRTRRKEKEKLPSGITADYTAHLGLHLVDGGHASSGPWPELPHSPISDGGSCTSDGTPSLNSLTSTTTTAMMMMKQETLSVSSPMPVPPARGILKGKSSYGLESPPLLELDDDNKLVENTLKNELIIYEKPPAVLGAKKLLSSPSAAAQLLLLPPPLPKSQPPSSSSANGQLGFQRARAAAGGGGMQTEEEDAFTYSSPRPHLAPLDAATAAAIAAAAGLVPADNSRPPSAATAKPTTTTTTVVAAVKVLWSEPPGEGSGWLDRIKTHKSLHSSSSSSSSSSLPLPALVEPALPEPRDLTLQRKETGDFGFSLRRSVVVERSPNDPSRNSVKRTVIFAEPVTGNTNKQLDAALLPGDRLLEVNGQNVQNTNREDIIDIIRNSGSTVTLKVQPVAELVELSRRWAADGRQIRLNDVIAKGGTLRRTGSLRHRHTKAKSDDELTKEKEWIESGRVWLQHQDGFTSARLHPTVGSGNGNGEEPVEEEEGRVRLKLDATGQLVSVDEDEVVKANPPQFDLAEDLAQLRHLNEASLLHTLRCRYAASLPHTYAGQSLVVINPVTPLAVYSERMIQLFRGCKAEDMPPHIYSSAQSAYRSMLATRCDQSLIFVGRSGSGKSHNFRNSLHYLCLAAGCPSKIITVEKLNSIFLLLEAFGNCRTALNTNATRFTNIFSLDFDQSGQIAAASIQVLMPERERVTRRPDGQPSFNVFYELVAGATGELRRYLQLDSVSGGGGPNAEPCAYMTPLQSAEDRQKAAVSYARLVAALESLGVAETDSRCIWSILAAIYHLGVAGAMRGVSNNKIVFARPAAAQRAAILLGIGSLEELAQLAFYATPVQGAMMNGRSSFRTGSPVHNADGAKLSMADKHLDPSEALEGFAQGLYVEAFSALVALINRSISSTARTISSIVAVDTPGFQNPATTTTSTSSTSSTSATFQDLCHNYTQERLQLLFHDTHITAQLNRYAQEHIDITLEGGTGEEEMPSPEPLVDLLDRAPQSAVARAQSATNLRDVERRGFLWLLDDEALVSTTSEDQLLDKLSAMYNDRVFEKLFTRPEGTAGSRKHLMIHHGQGTNSVLYDLDGWLKSAREMPTTRNAALALTESTKEEMASLFRSCRGPLPTTVSGSVAGIEGSQSLRRASSIRRTFTSGTAGIKRKSLALQLKFQVDGLIETLRRTKPRFVYCFIPNHRAGLVDLSSSTFSANDDSLQVPLLRSQLRGSELLPAIRLYRQGYPDYMPLGEFVRRFNVLVPPDALPASLLTGLNSSTASEKQAAEILLLHIDMERSSYRLGLSQVFFRPGVLSQLEDQRDEKITNRVIKFQAQCRGFLARKRLSKLKVQDVAIRCIQRNVRKLQAVRVWPWWRLMLRLSPLLNVHRTEEELKARTEEAESLRSRVTALEKERADLKYVADRLETKVSELTADLAEEHSTAILATERLEAETAQRMKLDKDFSELEAKFRKLSGDHEKMEMEVLLNRSAGLNGSGGSEYNMMMSGADEDEDEDEDDDDDGQPNVFRQKCERLSRELELAKQRLAQQHEDDLEQTVTLKKQLEKKLNDAYEEVEEQRQVVAQWKRKSQRLAAELSDTRLLHEDQTNRNAVLEKKQRKFDTELQLLHDELRQERGNKERAMRERDAAITDKLTSEQTLQSVQLDLEMRGERLAALTKELDEMTTDGRSDADMTALRRAKHELEMKVKDQEEELDELAGQVQLLESARLRLEMAMEQMRKENKKELAQREEEMEDTRCSAQKKVKALEAQLESEHEERTLLVREKHELERQLLSMAQHAAHAADDDTIHKLKRDLKRTKALLKDAHSQLERCRSETPSKVLLRQLKNQLEDSEFARTAAVKGRQHAEQELLEAQQQLDEALRLRGETEDKYLSCNRERSNYQSQVDDLEVELNEVMRKYKAAVAQLSVDQITLQDQTAQLMTLEHEKSTLKEQVAELSARLECLEIDTKSVHTQKRMELKVKELESRVELEQTSKSRLETQVSRLKEMLDKSNLELDSLRCKEQLSQESSKRLQRQLRDVREELTGSEQRDADTSQQLREFEQRIELLESENATLVKDLSLALRRIEDLQVAMQGEMDTSDSDQDPHSVDSDSDDDSDTSFHTFLSQRKYGSTSGVSSASDARRQSPTGLDSPSSSRVDLTSSLDKPEDESVA